MISFETYQKIKELYEIGLSKAKIARKIQLSEPTIKKWIETDEEELSSIRERQTTR